MVIDSSSLIAILLSEPEAARLTEAIASDGVRLLGSPGVLNYGDCLSYGVAKAAGERLLFKGDDFAKTDIPPATY